MSEKYQSKIIVQNPFQEEYSISKAENKSNNIALIKPFLDSPKEKKGLFVLTKEIPKPEQKDVNKLSNQTIQLKQQINLSPFQFHFPLTLSQNQKETNQNNNKEAKENSDFDIDVMTESWGLNKLEKMEKELEGDIDNDNDKLNIILDSKSKDKENNIEEINIVNDENDDELSISKNSIIDITEIRGSDNEKDEQLNYKEKEYSLSESVQKNNNKRRYLRGHCPFNFFEKEKCKNMDFKKINVRNYISTISAQWKIMTDKEKEPYVKLSEEFKRKILENNNLDDLEEMKLSNKKRRRRKRNANQVNKDNNNNIINKDEPKIINNNINFNNNKIENFSVYTTNRYVKKKAKINNNEINTNENKSAENETSSYIQQTTEKNENDKKNINNNFLNELSDKFKILKNVSDNKTNDFIKSVLIPFVAKSLEFLNNLTPDKGNEQALNTSLQNN